jgi:dihydroorotate dehydrogenase (NAD+) catalytic subunit
MPIVAAGGAETAEDVMEFLAAGASAVQIGTATFRNPYVLRDIARRLPELMAQAGIATLAEHVGRAHRPAAGAKA